MRDNPKLYELAKSITLKEGLPYTDPRTGETTQPWEPRKPRTKKKSRKKSAKK